MQHNQPRERRQEKSSRVRGAWVLPEEWRMKRCRGCVGVRFFGVGLPFPAELVLDYDPNAILPDAAGDEHDVPKSSELMPS